MGDRIARRTAFILTALKVALATGNMFFTLGQDEWMSPDGWVSGLPTVLLPAGNILGAVSGAFLAPIIGWRGPFLVDLTPAPLVLMIRYWVPESPRWLM